MNNIYTLTVSDSYGDGICCASGTGSYELKTLENVVIATGGDYGFGEETYMSNQSLGVDDYFIDCTSGTFSVTLPTAVGIAGKIHIVKNTGNGVITINTTSSQTIDDSLTKTLSHNDSLYLHNRSNNIVKELEKQGFNKSEKSGINEQFSRDELEQLKNFVPKDKRYYENKDSTRTILTGVDDKFKGINTKKEIPFVSNMVFHKNILPDSVQTMSYKDPYTYKGGKQTHETLEEWKTNCPEPAALIIKAIETYVNSDEWSAPSTGACLSAITASNPSNQSIELFMELFTESMMGFLSQMGYPADKFEINVKLKDDGQSTES